MGRHGTVCGVRRGSVQHAVLRVLDVLELSCADVLACTGDPQRMTPRRFGAEVLEPLRELGLLHRDSATATWGTTDAGSTAARQLGPIDGEPAPCSTSCTAAASESSTPAQHAARRTYMGIGDLRPPVLRAGSDDAAQLPSRIGSRLYWPGGLVTELAG